MTFFTLFRHDTVEVTGANSLKFEIEVLLRGECLLKKKKL